MNMLEWITNECVVVPRDPPVVKQCRETLTRHLSREDRKLVLRIIDQKDLMIEQGASEGFQDGFCAGG